MKRALTLAAVSGDTRVQAGLGNPEAPAPTRAILAERVLGPQSSLPSDR